jgi:hypothetical protein
MGISFHKWGDLLTSNWQRATITVGIVRECKGIFRIWLEGYGNLGFN